jgi:methylphosphotriester-DNA--protein-cysteine methyltransferase
MTQPEKRYRLTNAQGVEYCSDVPGLFGGHRRSRIYGRLGCRSAMSAIERGGYVKHRVFFADEPTAILARYRPCGVCLPVQYAKWKQATISSNESGKNN